MKTKAFTLIELLVVVLIIGILAAVALPQYRIAVLKARTVQLIPLIKAIDTAQQVYHLANGEYAADFSQLDIDFPAGATSQSATEILYNGVGCYKGGNDTIYSLRCDASNISLEKYYKDKYIVCWAPVANAVQTHVCKSLAKNAGPAYANETQKGYPIL